MSFPEPAPFIIRNYTLADFHAICAIDRLCFSEAISYTPEEMALGLAQRGAIAYVAESDGQVIAFVLASQNKRRGHIITIDILPRFRHKGLGRTLLHRAEQRLKARGAARVVLEVNVNNEDALLFYEEMQYSPRRLLAGYYPDGSDAWLMEKTLN